MLASAIVERFLGKRILVVGDVCLDHWLYVRRSSRPNPEAGGGILEVYDAHDSVGMAGLVADMVNALGGQAVLISPTGPWPEKTRIICDGEEFPRIDYDRRVPSIRIDGPRCDCILICDYGRGSISRDTVEDAIVTAAAWHDCPVIVDPARGESWEKYRDVTAIKCNQLEAENSFTGSGHIELAALVVTLDGAGCQLQTNVVHGMGGASSSYGSSELVETSRVDNANAVGAGDQFLAAIGLARSVGTSWHDACRIANAAARIKVQNLRTRACTARELVVRLDHSEQAVCAGSLVRHSSI